MYLSQNYSKGTKPEQEAIYWTNENNPKSNNIPKLNIHKIHNKKIKNLNTIKSKITDTAEDDYRSIDRMPIFEAHTMSGNGESTDYSYIKLNVTEYDPEDIRNHYKRKTYSIGFTHGKVVGNSCFKRFRKYSPKFIGANYMRSNLGAEKTISYDMFERILEAINDFANSEKPYCEFNNNHEDFIYNVSKKAGFSEYTSTFSSFFGLSRHNLYKRQLDNMYEDETDKRSPIFRSFFGLFKKYIFKRYIKKINDKQSFFEYFSEAGSSSEIYKEFNKSIDCLRDQLILNKSLCTNETDKENKNSISKKQEIGLSELTYILSSLVEENGKFPYFHFKIQNGLVDLVLSDNESNLDYDIIDWGHKYYIHKSIKERSYDKALTYKSVQRNLMIPLFERRRSQLLSSRNNIKPIEYTTNKRIIGNEVYIPDSKIPKDYKYQNINFEFNGDVKDKPLFPSGEPKLEDLKQTMIGDCYLIASLISIINTEQGRIFIKNLIKDNEDGTVTVTFYGEGKKIRVDKTIPTIISEKNALWVQMIEKAYAASNRLGHINDKGSYDSIVAGKEDYFISRISEKDLKEHRTLSPEAITIESVKQALGIKIFRSKLTQTESYNLTQLYIWKLVNNSLESNRNIFFYLSKPKKEGIMDHHSYTIIGCEKRGSHYFFKVVNPLCNRSGPRYIDTENLRSKVTFCDTFEKEGYFLIELSHFTDFVDILLIV